MLNFLWTEALAGQAWTRGQEGAQTGTQQSHMIDLWVKSARLTGQLVNSGNTSIRVKMYYLVARFDLTNTPNGVYGASVSGGNQYLGSVGNAAGAAVVEANLEDPGMNLWSISPVLSCFRVYKTKTFIMEPSRIHRFKLSDKKLFHVTARMSGMEAFRNRTKYIAFEITGQPVGDSNGVSDCSIGPGCVQLAWEKTYEYMMKPLMLNSTNILPYPPVVGTPAWLTRNDPTLVHTFVAA